MLSIIVPMYNEEKRLIPFISELLEFSEKSFKNCELIFVDDGSEDKTVEILKNLIGNRGYARIISYPKNKGKGHAVRRGVIESEEDKVIFIDADGSIPLREIIKMYESLDSYDIVIGTRAAKESVVKQRRLRKLTGTIFNALVNFLFRTGFKDHLCGIKGFRREVAKSLFNDLKSERWLFDVEILYKARRRKYSILEQPIHWEYKEGTKMKFFDPVRMFFKLIKLRLRIYRLKIED
ncbi:MAG: dolichyl-phosphate beta-glucosyltransferase [Methanosarcinales archaeon]